MKILLCIVAVIVVIPTLYYCFPFARVHGRSMFPTLQEGDILFTTRLFSRKKDQLKKGSVYVYRTGQDRLVIKRLDHTYTLGGKIYCYFLGDNPNESYDSRDYGYINVENIITKVLWHKKH